MQDLQSAIRMAGQNPTECEVQDMINKVDDGTASLDFEDFCLVLREKAKEIDPETLFKDTFRVFSKDKGGKKGEEDIHVIFNNGRLYSSTGDEVCAAELARKGDIQGGGGDDHYSGQEWGRQDQLLRVQSYDGRIPTCYSG